MKKGVRLKLRPTTDLAGQLPVTTAASVLAGRLGAGCRTSASWHSRRQDTASRRRPSWGRPSGPRRPRGSSTNSCACSSGCVRSLLQVQVSRLHLQAQRQQLKRLDLQWRSFSGWAEKRGFGRCGARFGAAAPPVGHSPLSRPARSAQSVRGVPLTAETRVQRMNPLLLSQHLLYLIFYFNFVNTNTKTVLPRRGRRRKLLH